ncbi:MAG: peptide chain release factor N(5)-glutamine methyltransferase [Armatimonadota bacterium]|nr:peptide chain release factor N(5)-glutamine methyltransferase [bacterium]
MESEELEVADASSSAYKELIAAAQQLASAGIENPQLESQLMMAKALDCSRSDIIAHPERPLSDSERNAFHLMVDKRASRYPLAYILGKKEFYGLDIEVAPGVLIPRPETEILVETAISRLSGRPMIADIGTGSGAIAVAIASNLPEAIVCATEISPEALKVARRNISNYQLSERVTLIEGDLLEPLTKFQDEFDAIISNPPYIPSAEIDSLEPEVSMHEPRCALDGGPDGLDVYRRLMPEALGLLKDCGFVAVEVGIDEAGDVKQIALSAGYREVDIVRDLAEIERVVVACR